MATSKRKFLRRLALVPVPMAVYLGVMAIETRDTVSRIFLWSGMALALLLSVGLLFMSTGEE